MQLYRAQFAPFLLTLLFALSATAQPTKPHVDAAAIESQPAIFHTGQISAKGNSPFGAAEQGNWSAAVDTLVFNRVVNSRGAHLRTMPRPIIGHIVELILPEKGPVAVQITGITELVKGVTTIEGFLKEDSESVATFSIENGRVLGMIRDKHINWVIEPDGSTHRIRKIDRRLLPAISDDVSELQSDKASDVSSASPKTGSGGRVDILFLYASDVSNPSSLASSIISNFNSALSSSEVSSNNYVASAGVQAIYDDFDGMNREAIIDDMVLEVSPFQGLKSELLFHAGADFVFLLVEEDSGVDDIPGYGRVGGASKHLMPSKPVALSTDDYALGDYSALHEIGHVFGGEHETFTDGTNRGKVKTGGDWQTLLGGYKECSFDGLPASCDRIRYFSNPDVSYGGESTGLAGPQGRDMESKLESSMVYVSSWRDNGHYGALDDPPASITNTSESCYGYNEVDWSTVSGASTYRLYESASSSFTSPGIVYTGSASEASVNVPSGSTRYYRARACDSYGCTDYSSQVFATYFPGCS